MEIKVLDPVILTEDLPSLGLKRGDMGAIVETYTPTEFEVEFVTVAGRTRALVALNASQVRPVSPHDIPAVRSLDAA